MSRKTFKPGRGYTHEDWEDIDSPELTDKQMAAGRPFAQEFPLLAESIRRTRRPVISAWVVVRWLGLLMVLVAIWLAVGLKFKSPTQADALKFANEDATRGLIDQCGIRASKFIRSYSKITGLPMSSQIQVETQVYAGATPALTTYYFVFDSIQLYSLIFPMIDIVGQSGMDCYQLRQRTKWLSSRPSDRPK